MKTNNWSLQTRILHIGLVLTVSAQLAISLVMEAPDHTGSAFEKLAFSAHEVVGMTALAIVLVHWAWSIFGHADGGLKHLLPIGKESRKEVMNDVANLKQGKLPETGKKGGLIGLIHGLGLLAVTGIAITGGALFVLFPETGEPGMLAEAFAEVHEGIATLVWAYWIGHGSMAILHHLSGHDTVKKMFSFQLLSKVGVQKTSAAKDKHDDMLNGHLIAQPIRVESNRMDRK